MLSIGLSRGYGINGWVTKYVEWLRILSAGFFSSSWGVLFASAHDIAAGGMANAF